MSTDIKQQMEEVGYTKADAIESIHELRAFLNSLGSRGMSAMEYGPYLNDLFMLEAWVNERTQGEMFS